MRIDVPIGEHLRLVAHREGTASYRVLLSGTLDHLAGSAVADAIRAFFVPGTLVVLDLTGVESYDPSMTMDLFALRREAKEVGARLCFSGASSRSVVHLQRYGRSFPAPSDTRSDGVRMGSSQRRIR